jgi:hypothetical protein
MHAKHADGADKAQQQWRRRLDNYRDLKGDMADMRRLDMAPSRCTCRPFAGARSRGADPTSPGSQGIWWFAQVAVVSRMTTTRNALLTVPTPTEGAAQVVSARVHGQQLTARMVVRPQCAVAAAHGPGIPRSRLDPIAPCRCGLRAPPRRGYNLCWCSHHRPVCVLRCRR